MKQFKQDETVTLSQTARIHGKPPSYLTSTTLCMKQLPLAIGISCLSFMILSLIIINSATLLFQTELSHLLSLSLGVFFLLSCTAAIWKHTLER